MPKLAELARLIKADLIGEPDADITRARPFALACDGDVTLASEATYLARVKESRATAFIVSAPIASSERNLLVAGNPKLAFARAIEVLHKVDYKPIGVSRDFVIGEGTALGSELSIHPRVTIGRDTVIGDRVTLHSGVVIGDRSSIGDDTVVHANVSIYQDCEIGKRVIIHAGAVIGADGFSFVPDEDGHQVKLLQLGRVRIEDDCEIGANTAVDRGLGDTILRRGVKLDNLIQVGHSTEIGEDSVIAGVTALAGGIHVGRRVVIAGQVGINQHVTIGDGAIVTGGAGVTKSVRPGAVVGGMIPAQDFNAWRRTQVLYSKLPELAERLRQLEKAVRALTGGSEQLGE